MSPLSEPEFDCMEVLKRMGDYVDRELSAEEVETVNEHLAACGPCAKAFEWEHTILRVVKGCASMKAEIPEKVRAQIIQSLDDAD